ncbi:MAG: ypdB, partial [Bacteroidetes bacterium]|nr:ypdB [Bacteroidota bacterium]
IFTKLNVETPVIFTTAYDEYAIRAFKFNSIDYLLKPIGLSDLKAALEKFNKLNASSNLSLF